MKQIKDLCIGNKVYRATINTIINGTVESISLNRSDENIICQIKMIVLHIAVIQLIIL